MTANATARRMALCCRQLAAGGLIAGRDGNLSVRLAPNRVLVTPSGLIKASWRRGIWWRWTSTGASGAAAATLPAN